MNRASAQTAMVEASILLPTSTKLPELELKRCNPLNPLNLLFSALLRPFTGRRLPPYPL